MSPGCILTIVVLIIVIVAWALFRNTQTPAPEAHIHHEETEAVEPAVEARLPSPVTETPVMPDDLTRLEGIGPKVNQVLKTTGITTFTQLANAEISNLREVLDAAGYQFMDPTGWIEQAKLASEGKFEDLKELQSRLKGGRKVG